jgi:LDH2 family malate/lactate/ureidoglycolate dehydrogenase
VEAISVVAQGKIVMAQKAGQSIPPGWAIDAEGRPTQDAEVALKGAVLPMGGYKGAGLALVIDALCGVLTGVAFGSHVVDSMTKVIGCKMRVSPKCQLTDSVSPGKLKRTF